MLHKDAVWEWMLACQTVFETLKEKLLAQPFAAYQDVTLTFRLYIDAQPDSEPSRPRYRVGRKE